MQADKIRAMRLLEEAALQGRTVDAMRALAASTGHAATPDWLQAAARLESLLRETPETLPRRPARRARAVRHTLRVPPPQPYQLSLLPNACS